MVNENEQKHTKIIFVNKKQIHVEQEQLTGNEILALAGYDSNNYDLFLVHGQKNEKIESEQIVKIENGMHFHAILRSVQYG